MLNAGAERLSSTLGVIPPDQNLAKMIDHTLLKPDATQQEIAQLCFEAKKYNFASVCVKSNLGEPLCAIAERLTGQGLHSDRFSSGGNLL